MWDTHMRIAFMAWPRPAQGCVSELMLTQGSRLPKVVRCMRAPRAWRTKGGQIDCGQHSQVERNLRRERAQPRPVPQLVRPRLRGEGVHVKEALEDLHLWAGGGTEPRERLVSRRRLGSVYGSV